MPNPDNCATFFLMTSLFFSFFWILTLSELPITPELGYCRHSDSRARSSDGGGRVKSYSGKTRGIPGDIVASSFPSSFCVASVSGSIFARSVWLSFLALCTETAQERLLHRLSHLSFFSSSIFRSRSSIWTPVTSTLLFSIIPQRGPRSLVMIGSCLCLLVCFCCFFYFCWCLCHIYIKGFLLCVLLLNVFHWNPNKLFHFPCVEFLCPSFYL